MRYFRLLNRIHPINTGNLCQEIGILKWIGQIKKTFVKNLKDETLKDF